MTEIPSAWSLRALHAGYGEVEALHGLDLDLPAHRITAVVGPGGSGKTTLLRTLAPAHTDAMWVRGVIRRPMEEPIFLRQARRDPQTGKLPPAAERLAAVDRALAEGASCCLLDEPADQLDDAERLQVIDSLRTGGERTLVCVTHDLAFARQVADHIVLLVEGRLIEAAPTTDFFERPRLERTRTFLRMGS
ncbi:MAG: ATP-binding cassette domain-containing protein [Acidobacteriota bacterium]